MVVEETIREGRHLFRRRIGATEPVTLTVSGSVSSSPAIALYEGGNVVVYLGCPSAMRT